MPLRSWCYDRCSCNTFKTNPEQTSDETHTTWHTKSEGEKFHVGLCTEVRYNTIFVFNTRSRRYRTDPTDLKGMPESKLTLQIDGVLQRHESHRAMKHGTGRALHDNCTLLPVSILDETHLYAPVHNEPQMLLCVHHICLILICTEVLEMCMIFFSCQKSKS